MKLIIIPWNSVFVEQGYIQSPGEVWSEILSISNPIYLILDFRSIKDAVLFAYRWSSKKEREAVASPSQYHSGGSGSGERGSDSSAR